MRCEMYSIPFSWIYRTVKFRLGHPCQCVRQLLLQLLPAFEPPSSAPPPNSKPKPTPFQSVITRHLKFEPASSSEQSRRFRSGRVSLLSMPRHPSKPQRHPNLKSNTHFLDFVTRVLKCEKHLPSHYRCRPRGGRGRFIHFDAGRC